MAQFPTGRVTPAADTAVRRISAALQGATRAMADWRVEMVAGNLNALTAREAYQQLASAKNIVEGLIGTPGLAGQYQQTYGKAGDYDPVTEWAAALAVINAFQSWFAANWPWRSPAPNNFPAFERGKANWELEAITDPLTLSVRNAIIAEIDKVLAAIE